MVNDMAIRTGRFAASNVVLIIIVSAIFFVDGLQNFTSPSNKLTLALAIAACGVHHALFLMYFHRIGKMVIVTDNGGYVFVTVTLLILHAALVLSVSWVMALIFLSP